MSKRQTILDFFQRYETETTLKTDEDIFKLIEDINNTAETFYEEEGDRVLEEIIEFGDYFYNHYQYVSDTELYKRYNELPFVINKYYEEIEKIEIRNAINIQIQFSLEQKTQLKTYLKYIMDSPYKTYCVFNYNDTIQIQPIEKNVNKKTYKRNRNILEGRICKVMNECGVFGITEMHDDKVYITNMYSDGFQMVESYPADIRKDYYMYDNTTEGDNGTNENTYFIRFEDMKNNDYSSVIPMCPKNMIDYCRNANRNWDKLNRQYISVFEEVKKNGDIVDVTNAFTYIDFLYFKRIEGAHKEETILQLTEFCQYLYHTYTEEELSEFFNLWNDVPDAVSIGMTYVENTSDYEAHITGFKKCNEEIRQQANILSSIIMSIKPSKYITFLKSPKDSNNNVRCINIDGLDNESDVDVMEVPAIIPIEFESDYYRILTAKIAMTLKHGTGLIIVNVADTKNDNNPSIFETKSYVYAAEIRNSKWYPLSDDEIDLDIYDDTMLFVESDEVEIANFKEYCNGKGTNR